jgi:hypothetical protein
MTRIAQVIVFAPYGDEATEPLARQDESRSWQGQLEPLGLFVGGWVIEFQRERPRSGLLKHLESLPWPNPGNVQVLIHDEEDDRKIEGWESNHRTPEACKSLETIDYMDALVDRSRRGGSCTRRSMVGRRIAQRPPQLDCGGALLCAEAPC